MSAIMDQGNAEAFYDERYEEIARYPFVADRPILIRDHAIEGDRRCRYCGRGIPEATFRKDAHAVPEFLGNKSLFSMNECDECNAILASGYEDHLAKWTHFFRAMMRSAGKERRAGQLTKPLRVAMSLEWSQRMVA
jgi:hypothetical protein